MIDKKTIRVNVIESLGTQNNIHKKIDEYYLKNKYQAHNLAIKDECYEHPIFKFKSIEHEVYCKRVLGLFCIDEEYYLNLLVKEANEKLYHYLITEEERYDFLKILEFISPKADGEEVFNIVTLAYGYAVKFGREFKKNLSVQTYEAIVEERFKGFGRDFASNLLKENKKQCRHVWLKFCSIHGFPQKLETFDDFLKAIYDTVDRHNIEKNEGRLYLVSQIMQYEGLESMFLVPCKLSDDDINISVQTYLKGIPEGKAPDYDAMIEHMIMALFTIALVREYKKVKEYYFRHNQETVFLEMEDYEDTIKKLNSTIEDLNDDLVQSKSEIKRLREENHRLKLKSKVEEKEIKAEAAKVRKEFREEISAMENALKKARKESEANGLELKQLRALLFPTTPVQGISPETAKQEINQHKKIVYAVTQDWGNRKIKRLKEQIPNLAFYGGIFPEKATAIFIDYQLISHSDYNDVITMSKRKKIPYYYIQSTGVGETIREIAETLRNAPVEMLG